MRFDNIEDMPEGMRKLYEKQIGQPLRQTEAQKRLAELPQAADGRKKESKYRAKPTDRTLPDGTVIRFDSKKEAAYFDTLRAMEQAGVVRDIRLQVQFLLKPAYTDGKTGERFRGISYLADFTYWQKNEDEWAYHIVDVKGRRTQEYTLKKKIMADLGHHIEEI